MSTRKTIVISFYGGVVSDADNTAIVPDFMKVVAKIKSNEHRVRIFSEVSSPVMDEWCIKNNFLPYDAESYDLAISPLALGAPVNEDGNIDWGVAEVILESLGILPSAPKQERFKDIPVQSFKFKEKE
jgi:hypothetical protein